ncbi:MAG: type II secretion system secretin GspD [Deltaproteobacteria bacterium]|nr:type II secretion system secretin GspD [Deltaproteobacteria bacterium]
MRFVEAAIHKFLDAASLFVEHPQRTTQVRLRCSPHISLPRGNFWIALVTFLTTILLSGQVFAADVTPLPPVVIDSPANPSPAAPPLKAPSADVELPPAIKLDQPALQPQTPVTTAPTTSPSVPSAPTGGVTTPAAPSSEQAAVAPSVGAPVGTAPAPTETPEVTQTGVPSVSQTLGPAPETKTEELIEEQGMYFNVADEDLKEVIKQISRALGKDFLLDEKSCKGKITIISERKLTKEEVWEVFLSALDANQCTVVKGPAGLYRLIPRREALSYPIEFYKDDSPVSDRFITRLITLKNISAADMANVIKGLVSKEGNLFAYPVTNTLILTDTGTNIDRLVRLIKELDTEGPQEIMEIIPIVFAEAKDIANKITQIFEEETKGDKGGGRKRGGKDEGGEDIPQIRKVLPDDRTNSIILLASKRAIQDIRDLIKKLDRPMAGEAGEIHVHYLKHAAAKDMASVLSSISGQVQKDKGAKGIAPPATGAGGISSLEGLDILGKFSVTSDESTNSLVITASAKDYQILVDRVISKLDIPRKQVYVEAIIVELSVAQDQQVGFGVLGGKLFNVGGNSIATFGSTLGFLGPNFLTDPSRVLSGTVGGVNTTNTVTINTPGAPGSTATTTLPVPAFLTALQLAQGNTDVNILSTPNILTLDNQEAEITVGQKVPFPSAQATTIGGSLQTSFTREDVALKLKIKPQISESDTIRLEVAQEDHEVLSNQPASAAQSGPSTTERKIKTTIVANNGQTIVLGGLIKDKHETIVNKVPVLGDIPLLGWLFKTRRKTKQKVNLVVFLTPNIIREPRDFLSILQRKVTENNAFIDENFSKSQRRQIKKSLEVHASHLAEFIEESEEATSYQEKPRHEEPIKQESPKTSPPAKKSNPPAEEDVDLAL